MSDDKRNIVRTTKFRNGVEKSRVLPFVPVSDLPKKRGRIRDDDELTDEEIEKRRKDGNWAARCRIVDAINTFVPRYFLTFTSPLMDTNPSVLLDAVRKYLIDHDAGKAFIILEPYWFESKDSVVMWHVHGLSENPVNLDDWIYEEYVEPGVFPKEEWEECEEYNYFTPENLYDCYCERIRFFDCASYYLTKKIYLTRDLLGKGARFYKTVGYKKVPRSKEDSFKSDAEFLELKDRERRNNQAINDIASGKAHVESGDTGLDGVGNDEELHETGLRVLVEDSLLVTDIMWSNIGVSFAKAPKHRGFAKKIRLRVGPTKYNVRHSCAETSGYTKSRIRSWDATIKACLRKKSWANPRTRRKDEKVRHIGEHRKKGVACRLVY